MKKLVTLLFIGALLYGCGNSESANQVNEGTNQELNKQKEKERRDSINNVLKTLKVRLYQHQTLSVDYDDYCEDWGDKIKAEEIVDYNNIKSYTSPEGYYIQKLVIEGSCTGLDIHFFDAKGTLIKELKGVNVDKSICFGDKDYQCVNGRIKSYQDENYQQWFAKARKIELFYQDSMIFQGEWKSNGYFTEYIRGC